MYHLTAVERDRLQKAIQVAYSIPFIDDLEDYIWEAVFAYVKDVPLDDPLTAIRSKRLFDLVDLQRRIGWSVKALQCTVRPLIEFEVVIQRADIFEKSAALGFDHLSKESPPGLLGSALLQHWYTQKVQADATNQGVTSKRVAILLKSRDRQRYACLEQDLAEYSESELVWEWTDKQKRGLQGLRRPDRFCVFRWYPSQKQLFERFILPADTYIFDLAPRRLPMSNVIELLLRQLDNKP